MNLHLWCHPYNWGRNPEKEVRRVLEPIVSYCRGAGVEFRTMKEMVQECESRES